MDVRCEQCQTEYELDEARVTETGVTVKCTQCGHMFKVRRRAATPPPPQAATQLPPLAASAGAAASVWLIRNGIGEIRRFRELTTLQQWIVERKVDRECEISRTGDTWKRLGDIAELASFFHLVDQADQREVARQRRLTDPVGHPVSASAPPPAPAPGAPVAPMRQQTTRPHVSPPPGPGAPRPVTAPFRPGTVPAPSGPLAATPGKSSDVRAPGRLPTQPPPTPGGASAKSPARPAPGAPVPVKPAVTGGWTAQPMGPAPGSGESRNFAAGGSEIPVFDQNEPKFVGGPLRKPAAAPGGSATGAWASQKSPGRQDPGEPDDGDDDGDDAPTPAPKQKGGGEWYEQGDLAKRANPPRQRPDAAPSRQVADDDTLKHLHSLKLPDAREPEDDEPLDIHPEYAPKNRTPLVIAMIGLVLFAIAGSVWYFALRKKSSKAAVLPVSTDGGLAAAPAADAAAPLIAPLAAGKDAGAAKPAAGTPAQAAIARLDDNTDAAWASAETELAALALDGKSTAAASAGLALLELARAEARIDEAELLEVDAAAGQASGQTDLAAQARRDAKRKRTEAAQGIARGKTHAARALSLAPTTAETALAQAELAVATKAPAAMVERHLKTLFAAQPDDARGMYLRALTLLAAKKPADAEAALVKLGGLPRALYRLALLRGRAGRNDEALTSLEALLALQPTHGRALGLRVQLTRTPLTSVSPQPSASPATSPGGPVPSPSEPPVAGGVEAYDTLVARADKLAENGKSDAAIVAYKKALEARANGVEALSGLGYAYLDRRDYEGAVAYFESALRQSSGYSDALIGLAETYKGKGDKGLAINAYRRYLDKYPSGSKAAMAKRNISDLGGDDTAPTPTATPEPTPEPTASPSPTPESTPAPTAPPDPSPSPATP